MGRGAKSRGGSTALEFAIVLPALLMFMLGLVDCGRLLWSYAMLERAVESAARCAVVNKSVCATATAIQSYGAGEAWGLGLAASAFTVSSATCGTQVVGKMTFQFVIPWFYGTAPFGASNAMALSALACDPV